MGILLEAVKERTDEFLRDVEKAEKTAVLRLMLDVIAAVDHDLKVVGERLATLQKTVDAL